jgi:hypothetical protein
MLPAICLHARISFRLLDSERREEAVQNCIANRGVSLQCSPAHPRQCTILLSIIGLRVPETVVRCCSAA